MNNRLKVFRSRDDIDLAKSVEATEHEIKVLQAQLEAQKQAKATVTATMPPKAPNTIVYDKVNGWGLEYIEKPEGRQKLFEGKPMFAMNRKWALKGTEMEATLEALPEPVSMKASPRMLYRGLKRFEALTPVAFGKTSDVMKTVKLVLLVVVIAISIFGIFLVMGG